MTENLYAVGQRECWKLGDHYTRNSLAMTAEGLHSKADIAAELGVRDAEIERLRAANAQMLEHGREMWADVERLRPIATAAEAYVKRWKTTQGTCEEGGMLDVWSALFNAVEGAQDEPTCSDPGWEMRGGKMVCKGCGREAGDVFAESPSEGPLRRGIGRGYYWLSMEACDSLIAAAELHGVSVIELGVRTKDGFSCVTGVPVKDLKDAVKREPHDDDCQSGIPSLNR